MSEVGQSYEKGAAIANMAGEVHSIYVGSTAEEVAERAAEKLNHEQKGFGVGWAVVAHVPVHHVQ